MADGALIRVLPADVVNRIAAGEVVERPASVVKELIENAIDADARRIDVEVREGGRALVRVADDGRGMSADDLAFAFTAHATSKLSDVEDLLHIGSLGFRGEALASIGAVSRATITSRLRGATAGHVVEDRYGELSEVRPAAAREGTTVEAADLFRNVPARSKFLKSPSAEMARVTEVVNRFGIAHPEVAFTLTHGGRKVASFPAGMERRDRIARAFGRDLHGELIETDAEGPGVRLVAYLAPPSRTYRDSTRMLLFLNGRFVRDRTITHAIRAAYDDLIFGPRNPMAFLFVTMDPAIVDVNVHPAKMEVRFTDTSRMHSLVHRTLREALLAADLAHPVSVPEEGDADPRREDHSRRVREAVEDYLARAGAEREPPRGGHGGGGGQGRLFSGGVPGAGRPGAGGPGRGAVDFLQVRDTFLVLEEADGIRIVDQHALHERVLYNRIRRRYLAGEAEVQRLLRPVLVELGPTDLEIVLSARESLAALGLLVEPFGDDCVAVNGVPAAASDAEPAALVEGVLESLAEDRPAERDALVERLLATLACHSAVKAGDPLDRRQVADLLVEAEGEEHAATCPHGRPTTLRIGYDQLERHFRRRG